MRSIATGLLLLVAAGGCTDKAERAAAADANAAGFVPPSIVSRVDYGTLQDRRFRRLDRNGDDVLEKTELPRVDSRLLALDRNGDGRITTSEFTEGQMARFDAMDLNKDGTLTSDERIEARSRQ